MSDALTPENGLLLEYEWFAGWRWERHSNGSLAEESLVSFENRDECIADAERKARTSARGAFHGTSAGDGAEPNGT